MIQINKIQIEICKYMKINHDVESLYNYIHIFFQTPNIDVVFLNKII